MKLSKNTLPTVRILWFQYLPQNYYYPLSHFEFYTIKNPGIVWVHICDKFPIQTCGRVSTKASLLLNFIGHQIKALKSCALTHRGGTIPRSYLFVIVRYSTREDVKLRHLCRYEHYLEKNLSISDSRLLSSFHPITVTMEVRQTSAQNILVLHFSMG